MDVIGKWVKCFKIEKSLGIEDFDVMKIGFGNNYYVPLQIS